MAPSITNMSLKITTQGQKDIFADKYSCSKFCRISSIYFICENFRIDCRRKLYKDEYVEINAKVFQADKSWVICTPKSADINIKNITKLKINILGVSN